LEGFRWAVVGTGHAASKFINDLEFLPGHSVRYIASSQISSSSRLRDKFRLDAELLDQNSFPKMLDVDAVYISTHSNQHFSQVLSLLQLGKPILCEKPLALSNENVVTLYEASRSAGVPLLEGVWTLLLPNILKLKELTTKARLDTPCHLIAEFGKKFIVDPKFRLFSKELSGGALYDLGIYPVSLALFLFGEPSSIAFSTQRNETGLIEDFTIQLKYIDGTTATLRSSIVENLTNDAKVRFNGNAYRVEAPFISGSSVLLESDGGGDVLFRKEHLGIGLWYEAEFVQRVARGELLEKLDLLQTLSIQAHRILSKVDQG
jgi:predicted dehydrogenase